MAIEAKDDIPAPVPEPVLSVAVAREEGMDEHHHHHHHPHSKSPQYLTTAEALARQADIVCPNEECPYNCFEGDDDEQQGIICFCAPCGN